MKRLGIASLLLLVSTAAGAQDFQDIKQWKTLRVITVAIRGGADELWSDDPQRSGLEREMLQQFCAVHGLGMELVEVKSWSDLVPALLEGKGDVIAGRVTVTARRKQDIDFTVPYFPTRLVLLTYRPHAVIASLDDLKGDRIGTVKGTSMEETLRNAQLPTTIDASFAPGTLPESLRSGKVPVIALGIEQAIPELKDQNVQLGMFVGPASGLAWGVRKGSLELRRELDAFLNAFLAAGQWNKLVVRYFGASAPQLLKKARSAD
jgi:ABC-type amino acid transport substrate-binding protein